MSRFNYFFNTPYTNPAGEIDKTTNELPAKRKARTTVIKRQAKQIKVKDTTPKAEEVKVEVVKKPEEQEKAQEEAKKVVSK